MTTPLAQDPNIMTRMLAMKTTLMHCYDMLDAFTTKTPFEINLMEEIRQHLLPNPLFESDHGRQEQTRTSEEPRSESPSATA